MVDRAAGFSTGLRSAVLAALTIGLMGSVAMAQAAGTLDSTFGTGGTVTTIFTGKSITPIGAVEQSNGDIVVLSEADLSAEIPAYTQFALTRYTPAGVQDTTFGTLGTTLTTFTTFTFSPFALALEPNGEFLVGDHLHRPPLPVLRRATAMR